MPRQKTRGIVPFIWICLSLLGGANFECICSIGAGVLLAPVLFLTHTVTHTWKNWVGTAEGTGWKTVCTMLFESLGDGFDLVMMTVETNADTIKSLIGRILQYGYKDL